MPLEARRRRLASFWGTFALLACLRVLGAFAIQVHDEVEASRLPGAEVLRERIGWLRPAFFRSPLLDGYVLVYLGLGLGVCLALWGLGLWRWWRERRVEREAR